MIMFGPRNSHYEPAAVYNRNDDQILELNEC